MDRERREDQDEERKELDARGRLLEAAAHLDARPLQRDEADEHGDGHRRHRRRERRQQDSHEFGEPDRHVAEHTAVGQPIGPADRESNRVAEGVSRVDVVPALFRQHRAELGEAHGADQRIQTADDPDEQHRRRRRQLAGDQPRRPQDTDPERAADDDGEAEAEAEHAPEAARRGSAMA